MSRHYTLGYDPRESRLGYDPRESRLGYDPRESRLGYDPRESRLGYDPIGDRIDAIIDMNCRLGQVQSSASQTLFPLWSEKTYEEKAWALADSAPAAKPKWSFKTVLTVGALIAGGYYLWKTMRTSRGGWPSL